MPSESRIASTMVSSPQVTVSPSTPGSVSTTPAISLNYVQLAKPFLTRNEISYMFKNAIKSDDLLSTLYRTTKREAFQFMIELTKVLKFPTKILQNACYLYQRFYLFCNDFKKCLKLNYEVAITSIFISLKVNDFIKKINIVIMEAQKIRNITDYNIDETRRRVMRLEKQMMEFGSFDFRSYSIESFVIKFSKFFEFDKDICFIIWSITNDLYFTELSLQLPAHFNAMAAIELGLRIWNELKEDKVKVDFRKLGIKVNYDNIDLGVSELLEFYLHNYDWTFIRACINELGTTPSENMNDTFISLNIEHREMEQVSSKRMARNKPELDMISQDQFFKHRDTEIVKSGSLRFLYNRRSYADELEKESKLN